MFDMNQEILKWRNSLTKSDTLGKSDVDELESHLREEIESLASLNLSEEESFWLARRRLGGAADLEGEFAKINRPAVMRTRLFWMAAGVLAYILSIQSGTVASRLSVLLAAFGGLRSPGLGIVHVASQLVMIGVTLYFCYRVCRRFCESPEFSRWAGGISERNILFAGLAVIVVMLATVKMSAVGVPGWIGVEEVARVAIVSAYTQLILSLLLPVLLLLMLILLRRSGSKKACA